ncbi:potassium channel family protein [Belliella kenyensis]|uniref:Potassium channel family protein n=3 Tax=Belliella TaxID=232244 RepID=A0ABV8EPE1_9BACT|nr:TrkA family potassium uptake protein [Belliella kenyensis]MCH7402488.1 TrkA family potassium uptake protein [Belliella kenyensis]MDN3603287.1 TrkA family potassium uptake protein [Belliella kenyensis]
MKYIIVGLGNFGGHLAARLTAYGHEVIGVDSSEDKVDAVKDKITHAVVMDATDAQAVKNLPCKDADVVIIAIGEDFGASIMVTAIFKQLNIKRLISRSINKIHETVIKAIGVDEILHPEEDSAERMAKSLQMKGVIDSLDVSDDYNIIEVQTPKRYVGLTISETKIRQDYNINILSLIKMEEKLNIFGVKSKSKKVTGVVTANTVIEEGDILLLFGHIKDINTILNLTD